MQEYEIEMAHIMGKISRELLNSKYILEILQEIIDGDGKIGTLTVILRKNLLSCFDNIEKCREFIRNL